MFSCYSINVQIDVNFQKYIKKKNCIDTERCKFSHASVKQAVLTVVEKNLRMLQHYSHLIRKSYKNLKVMAFIPRQKSIKINE